MIFEIPEEITHKEIKSKLVKTKENTLQRTIQAKIDEKNTGEWKLNNMIKKVK
jgi:hypothetical protein